MRNDELATRTALELRSLISTKAVSPLEVMAATIARAEALNPLVNAICTPTFEAAMMQARAAEQAIMQDQARGILHGLPITLKDLSFTQGVRTMGGSHLFRDR